MGFVSSFIIISLLGLFSHYLYHKFGLKNRHLAWIFYYSSFVVIGFLILDISFYIGLLDLLITLFNKAPWVEIENGKDFMWNSFQFFGIDWNINFNDSNLNFIAIILFLSYPLWFLSFKDLSRKLFGGNKPYERGLFYFLSRTKKPKHDTKIVKFPEKD
jgi:hypothetical protein